MLIILATAILLAAVPLAVLVLRSPASPADAAGSAPPARANATARQRQLIIGGAQEWDGICHYRADGSPLGIGYQLASEIAAQLDLEPVYRPGFGWPRCLRELEKGTIDVMAGAYFTEERAQRFHYSPAFHHEAIRIWVLADHQFPFQQWSDLIGRVGARPDGGSYGAAFDAFAAEHLNFLTTKHHIQTRELLIRKRVDYVILAEHDGMANLAKAEGEGAIVALPTVVDRLPIHMLWSRLSPHANRLSEIDQIIAATVESQP